jgi:flagellar hook-basal body complex protein FliE
MPVDSLAAVSALLPTTPVTTIPAPAATPGTGAEGFASSLAAAVDGLSARQARAADLAVQAVTGRLDDVHDYTIAATEAQVALELTAAIRNRAVEAFTEIMRMQV